ncbi:MAG: ammonia-forming cytochrome c nitrite reductase subunit c552, partial [Candidatus Aminicenantes bacterium]
ECISCHKEEMPGLYNQWADSTHGKNDVTCIDCHGADEKEVDAFKHNDVFIATLVTPKDCSLCHEAESEEVSSSYHATAGEILDSQDAYLAHVAGGHPAAITGCESCHGAKVIIDPDAPNKLAEETWPNSGIGRINPDGSKGTCSACHTRHSFSRAQARQPEVCSKCHLGPDHPQKEVYEESKHGNTYYTNIYKMNLDSRTWVVGKDYFVAPTCATCHMSATEKQAVTHNVGQRISWTLRPIISKKKDNWEKKRENMLDVCTSCHGVGFAKGHYFQFDGLVNLYNEKFARPALEIITMIRSKKLLKNPASFSNKVEWIFWELWHHEGRRARHGASMMGPDYTWWHGIYEVAQHFYFKFIPEALEYDDSEVNAYIRKLLETDPMHNWLSKQTEELKKAIRSGKMQEIYKQLLKQE